MHFMGSSMPLFGIKTNLICTLKPVLESSAFTIVLPYLQGGSDCILLDLLYLNSTMFLMNCWIVPGLIDLISLYLRRFLLGWAGETSMMCYIDVHQRYIWIATANIDVYRALLLRVSLLYLYYEFIFSLCLQYSVDFSFYFWLQFNESPLPPNLTFYISKFYFPL